MGIYRGGFRRYEGPLFPPAGRFTVILTHELAGFRRSRWVVLLFILAMLPLVVMTAAVFVKGTLEKAGTGLPFNVDLLRSFLTAQLQFLALMAAVAGAGLIAEDRSQNALLLYLSRPLSPRGYLLGKGLALAALLSLIYLAPTLVFLSAELLVGGRSGLLDTLASYAKALLACGLHVAVTGLVVLAFSSLGRRSRYVGLAWVALYFLSKMIARGIAREGDEWALYLSLPDLYLRSARFVLEWNPEFAWDFLILAALGTAALAVLVQRVRKLQQLAVAG